MWQSTARNYSEFRDLAAASTYLGQSGRISGITTPYESNLLISFKNKNEIHAGIVLGAIDMGLINPAMEGICILSTLFHQNSS